jgi:hypothetical protein
VQCTRPACRHQTQLLEVYKFCLSTPDRHLEERHHGQAKDRPIRSHLPLEVYKSCLSTQDRYEVYKACLPTPNTTFGSVQVLLVDTRPAPGGALPWSSKRPTHKVPSTFGSVKVLLVDTRPVPGITWKNGKTCPQPVTIPSRSPLCSCDYPAPTPLELERHALNQLRFHHGAPVLMRLPRTDVWHSWSVQVLLVDTRPVPGGAPPRSS